MPWVQTVTTKQGLGWNAALSKHPVRACQEIRAGIAKAAGRLDQAKCFRFDEPLTVEFRFKRIEGAQNAARSKSGWEWIDTYTCRREFAKLGDIF
jgi:D-amino peptidase